MIMFWYTTSKIVQINSMKNAVVMIDTCYFKLGNNEHKENLYLFDL